MRRLLPLLLLIAPASFGYIRSTAFCAAGIAPADCPVPAPLVRPDNTGIQVYLNEKVVPGAQSTAAGKGTITVISATSDPRAAVQGAFASWNNISTANIKFLELKTTPLTIDSIDEKMVIAIGSSAADLSTLGSAVAVTVTAYYVDTGVIVDSDIILNPAVSFSTNSATAGTALDLQAVLTHELGHALGANHTGLLGATMYQTTSIAQRFVSTDDTAFAGAAYPAATPVAFGTITGKVSTATAAAVAYALITAIDQTDQGGTFSGVTSADGTFSLTAPPGSYIVYAEPLRTINIYLTSAQLALAQATPFKTTLFGTAVALAANGSASANITVASVSATLSVPSLGTGAAGASGDVKLFGSNLPIPITSGTTFDLAFTGSGFDKTSVLSVYGSGITVGKVSVDSTSDPAKPLLRATLTVKARQNRSLASVHVTTGANTVSLSGILVIVPPVPVAPLGGVVSAAAGGSVGNVSPGEYVSLYGTGIGPATGPYFGIGYTNTGYEGGYLPQNLGGASITFDGIPAPMFFTSGGQINLQVPYEVAPPSTKMVVSFFGSTSTTVTVPVVDLNPAVFTFPDVHSAFAANFDGTVNTVANPAPKGTRVTVVGTGIGRASYPIETGAPAPIPPSSTINANGFTATLGSKPLTVLYSGWYNGFTSEARWDFDIPADAPSGAVPIVFSKGGVSTQSNVNLQIQ